MRFKEGDKVFKGQTIASLDSYVIQRQLQLAMNNYKMTRENFDQAHRNKDDNYLKTQQIYPYDTYAKAGMDGNGKDSAIDQVIQIILDQNQANLDAAVIQTEIANYAYTLASINSPINGVLIHEDVTTANQIVTPVTTFTVIDPNAYVFKANVPEEDIQYVGIGQKATIALSGNDKKYDGQVVRIYPDKIVSSTGENVYQVDIQCEEMVNIQYKQNGVAMIQNNQNKDVKLVSSWMILGGSKVWVEDESGKTVLRDIKIGQTNGGYVEVVSGLENNDKVVDNPESLISNHYLVY